MKTRIHPLYYEFKNQYQKGEIPRREFLRLASLLGVSVGASAAVGGFFKPGMAKAATPKRGGVLKVSQQVQKVTHPSQFSWIMPSNVTRQVLQYMTLTDHNNVSHPYLLEGWEATDDLKTWTMRVRKGVKFNNGDPFTSDDCIFTINEWLNPDTKSSMLGLVGNYLDPTGIERVDDHTFTLHLKNAEIAIPEHFFQYPASVFNSRTFEGDFLKAPHGTGPYKIKTYKEGELAELVAREDYWQKGADGKPLPYLDGMKFIDMGGEMAPQIAALKSGEIHMIDNSDSPGPMVMMAVKGDKAITVLPITTATTRVMRMRVDQEPFTDNRVRKALKMCQHREKILMLAFQGEGLQGQDFHVAPTNPDYAERPIPAYDPEGAKKLLAEAGYPDGIDMEVAVGTEWTDVVRYMETLQQDAAPAGIRLKINAMPTSQYWEKWTEVALGVTPWTHRPLGVMFGALAYNVTPQGEPVTWNETRWVDEEYIGLLKKASGILDAKERSKVLGKMQDIQAERGSIGIAYWMNTWMCVNSMLKGVNGHPNLFMLFDNAYIEG